MRRLGPPLLLSITFLLSVAEPARAQVVEPWADDDGIAGPTRHEFGDYGLQVGAEYRANWLYVNPVDLNGVKHRRASWVEHRLRLDATVDYDEKVRLVMSFDGLDGTLWGDNGTFGQSPSPNSGTRVAATNPNNAKPGVGYVGGDELDPDSYGYVLVPSDSFKLRRAYGEVVTPVGLLRIGRQPTTEGMSILVADGDGRTNRFGYANAGDTTDRVLFVTKPLEGFKDESERDTSRDRGLFTGAFYDRGASKDIRLFGDDLHGAGMVVRWLDPDPIRRTHLEFQGTYAHRWERFYDTNVNIVNLKAVGRLDRLTAGLEGVGIFGRTREVSEALSLINNDPIVRQKVEQFGARAVLRWDEPTWTAYLEGDLATGDRNPNPGTALTQLVFAEDNNVGLLMFERILHFESARSSAAGVVLLERIGADTFPAERVDTEGSFTNAVAVFPQFDLRPHKNVLLRSGLLLAWAPSGTVDPTESLKARDGASIQDDLVNFNGGKPGNFYGAELDGRFQWKYLDHFLFDLEGAILFPGDAFHDENGQAVRSVLIQGRTTFVF
ncbi:MAG: alginate export family protein [Myxococcales bacterium]|nr:alginate export family protein [Myxococcales bacterium]